MSRTSALILLGILVMLVPYSGFPSAMRSLLTVVLGACVFGIGLILRAREPRRAAPRADEPAPETQVEPAASEPSHGVSPI
ncbi:hypothetical protein KGQ25_02640 [Patescibacteria group bacterium]|nr:hypothetical protein [Patescibacteria group bacterium]MDE2173503.1 hypothetical protein [Patescibacteria group bacterium]